jgi:hypothetical protein
VNRRFRQSPAHIEPVDEEELNGIFRRILSENPEADPDEVDILVRQELAGRPLAGTPEAEELLRQQRSLGGRLKQNWLVLALGVLGLAALIAVGVFMWPQLSAAITGREEPAATATSEIESLAADDIEFNIPDTVTANEAVPFTITVRDIQEFALPGATVRLTTTSGILSPSEVTTDSLGMARFTFTGGDPGEATITAAVGDLQQPKTVTIENPRLPLVLRVSPITDTIIAGEPFKLEFIIENESGVQQNGIWLELEVPDGLAFDDENTQSPNRCVQEANELVRCEMANVSPGSATRELFLIADEQLITNINMEDYRLVSNDGLPVLGNEPIPIVVSGPAILSELVMIPELVELPADGQTMTNLVLELRDQRGRRVGESRNVRILINSENLEIPKTVQCSSLGATMRRDVSTESEDLGVIPSGKNLQVYAKTQNGRLYVVLDDPNPVDLKDNKGWVSQVNLEDTPLINCDDFTSLEQLPETPPRLPQQGSSFEGQVSPTEVEIFEGVGEFTYTAGIIPGEVVISVESQDLIDSEVKISPVRLVLFEMATLQQTDLYPDAISAESGSSEQSIITGLPEGTPVLLSPVGEEIDSETVREVWIDGWIKGEEIELTTPDSPEAKIRPSQTLPIFYVGADVTDPLNLSDSGPQFQAQSLNHPVTLLSGQCAPNEFCRVRIRGWVNTNFLNLSGQ